MALNKSALAEKIDQYERGDSSLEDDQMLLDFFTGDRSEISSDAVRAQFVYFDARKNESLPNALESRLHAVLETRSTVQMNVRLWLRVAAVLLVCLGVGWLVIQQMSPTVLVASTGPSEVTTVVLSDSTVVFLNRNSELSYHKYFNSEYREVRLKGEAYFEVKRDSLRPFKIRSGDVVTEVLGTAFNLRHYEDEQFTEIDVKSGQVLFGAKEKIPVVKGNRAVYFVNRKAIEVTAANANADSWRTGLLRFENAKLNHVVGDIERYFQIHIDVKNPSLMDCHFTGNFDHAELEDVLKVVAYSLNIQYTLTADTCVLTGQHCQQ